MKEIKSCFYETLVIIDILVAPKLV